MNNHYKKLLDQLDDLMIALSQQKNKGLDVGVVVALRKLTKARNAFKREFIKSNMLPKEKRNETVFTYFLDSVSDCVRASGPDVGNLERRG